MFLNIPLIEWIGYLGSVVVAISLTMSSIIRLRWLNLAGSAVFSFYGFAIGSLPVGLLNLFIAFVNIYFLSSIYLRKDAYKLLSIQGDNPYISYFLDFYKAEIRKFFPDFEQNKHQMLEEREQPISLIILRNAAVAGLFLGNQQDGDVEVYLDFVIPEYRDMKPGKFLYEKNLNFFRRKGIKRLVSQVKNEKHLHYLKHMGFEEQDEKPEKKLLIKTIKN
ncbi:MAG: GNAT family N-acetyltransferase [Bacteroides sp.]|jgi:hypothetical protein|nr:GNAT family N-acetyltransferase [Bacteroides sp.]